MEITGEVQRVIVSNIIKPVLFSLYYDYHHFTPVIKRGEAMTL